MVKQALFIDGPNIGEILDIRAPDDSAPTEIVVPNYPVVRVRFDPIEFPNSASSIGTRHYTLLRGIYPFFHCYTTETIYSDYLSHRAVKFIELAVEQQRANTVDSLLKDFEIKNAHWQSRITGISSRLAELETRLYAMNETSDDDN